PIALLKEGVVDRGPRRLPKGIGRKQEPPLAARPGPRGLACCPPELRHVALGLGREHVSAEGEHSAVPVVPAVIDEGLRALACRLLMEARDAECIALAFDRARAPDVAELGRWISRTNAECAKKSAVRERDALGKRASEMHLVGNEMIAGQRNDDRLG